MQKNDPISRRKFIQLAGGLTAGMAVLQACGNLSEEFYVPESQAIEPLGPGINEFKVTLCSACGGGCSQLIRLIDDRAVGIRGNPLSPLNRGHLCPRGIARLEHLYNPDRIRSPLRRTGRRGENKWEEISWSDAIGSLSKKMSALRVNYKSHQAAVLTDNRNGIDHDLVERFMSAYGSPNLIEEENGGVANEVMRAMYGETYSIGYDLENCNYLLCFGDILGVGSSPVWAQGIFGYIRQGRPGARTKIVNVSSRVNLTGANCDEIISVKPGTEGALALGIAYLIIQQENYDRDFVENYTYGFKSWQDGQKTYAGFKDNILNNYPPRRVSEITGVPIHIISKLAVEFARNKPAVAIGWYRSTETTNTFYNLMAIEALNGLVGSIDKPGGVIRQASAPLGKWDSPNMDQAASNGIGKVRLDSLNHSLPNRQTGNTQAFLDAMANKDPYSLEVLITVGSNPIYDEWGSRGYNRTFDQIDLLVAMTPFMNETAKFADLVMPVNVDLESWGYSNTVSRTNLPSHLSLQQPVVKVKNDTRQAGDIFLELARQIGGNTGEAMHWKETREALFSRLMNIAEVNEGMITAGSYEKEWLRSLARKGWRSSGFTNRKDFIEQLMDKGGWWDPLYNFGAWKRHFSTPSGKFEFASLSLLEWMKSGFLKSDDPLENARKSLRLDGTKDVLIQPHYEAPVFEGNQDRFPLILIPYVTVGIGEGEGANQPLMEEFIDPLYSTQWENVIELHPNAARATGVNEGDDVYVESIHARLLCRVKVSKATRPDVASIAVGLGHDGYGRFADRIGINPGALLAKQYDRIGGGGAIVGTRVSIKKA